MAYTYIVPLQRSPTKSEIEAAWWFTVISRAGGSCQHCGAEVRLQACHIKPRRKHPGIAWDPDNGIALCSSCHKKHDHANGHFHSGRPAGYKASPEERAKISAARQRWFANPENREKNRQAARKGWDSRGRKNVPHPCRNCGEMIVERPQRQFCSKECRYGFFRGKTRTAS